MKDAEDEAFDELAKRQGAWGGGYQAKKAMAAAKLQEPPSEWAGIKAILDEYGLQAIDFVADFKAALAQPAQEPVSEALKLALEALEKIFRTQYHIETPPIESLEEKMRRIAYKAITAIKEALAQPVQEQRPWVGLTEKEVNAISTEIEEQILIRLIEAELKEKNNA